MSYQDKHEENPMVPTVVAHGKSTSTGTEVPTVDEGIETLA